jgi:WD repeat-containing protein 23
MTAGWESVRGGTVIARHEYKGPLKMRGALEDLVEKRSQEAADIENLRRSARLQTHREYHIPGAFVELEDFGEDNF